MGHAGRVICTASVRIGLTCARIEFSCVGLRGGLGAPPIAQCWGLADVVCLLVWVPCRGVCPSSLEMSYGVFVKVLLRAPQSADVMRVL